MNEWMKQLPVNLMLYDIQSAVNYGQIFRTCEMFQIWLQIYDPRKNMSNHEKMKTISDFSCGAFTRFQDVFVEDFVAYKAKRNGGRIIATCLREDAIPLPEFSFEPGDTVLMGNEYDGLPADVIANADATLYIPLPMAVVAKPISFTPIDKQRGKDAVNQNGVPNLSVSIAAGLVAYAIHLQRMEMENQLRARANARGSYNASKRRD
ncbi:MAG: TrmH family RNA methyltransferase [Alphaproteobacteria bacterium]